MNFLNPTYLYFFPLVFIPLIIYLLFRKKLITIVFSSLYILKELAKKKNRRFKFQNILLLIIRTFIVMMILLLFLSPYQGNTDKYKPEKPSKIYIHLDTSPSMNRNDNNFKLMDKAKSNAEKLLLNLPEDSELFITSTGNRKEFVGSKKDAAEFIAAFEQTNYESDLNSIFFEADSFFSDESEDFNKYFFMFTDGKVKITEDSLNLNKNAHYNIIKSIITKESEFKDISIDSVKTNLKRGKTLINCFLSDFSGQTGNSAYLELFFNNKKVYEEEVKFSKSRTKLVEIKRELDLSKNISAYFKLSTDDNEINNKYYFSLARKDKNQILIVANNDDTSNDKIVKIAKLKENEKLFSFTKTSFGNINSFDISKYPVLILNNIENISSYTASLMKKNLDLNKSLFIILGNRFSINNYNTILAPKLGLPSIIGYKDFKDSYAGIDRIDLDSEIFHDVFVKKHGLSSIEIKKYHQLNPIGWKTLLGYGNDPILMEKIIPRGRILLLTSSLEKEWSNISENGLVVPLIENGIKYLALNGKGEKICNTAGKVVSLNAEANIINSPSGNEITINGNGNFVIDNEVGFYWYLNENNLKKILAVNSEREDASSITESQEMLKISDDKIEIYEEDELQEITAFFGATESYFTYIIIVLISLLILELFIARKK